LTKIKIIKKYICLVLGFILFLPVITGLNLKPPTNDYNVGYDLGVLTWPIIGIVLIYKFFRFSRQDRKKKKEFNKNKKEQINNF